MAKQLENSLERFAPARPFSISRIAAPVAVALTLAALVVALTQSYWLIAAILALSLFANIALVLYASRAERRSIGGLAARSISWEAVSPEVQQQDLRISVAELSRVLGPEFGSESELQSAFIVAVDLALRQIQLEEGVPVMRHISIAGVPFDVAFVTGDVLVCGDVYFLVAPELNQERVLSAMRKITAVKGAVTSTNVRLMMLLVTQMTETDVVKLRETLGTKRFSSTPVDIDIRLLDFESLQRSYVTEK